MAAKENGKKPFVSRIGVARLFNLGNYEHIRYDITVDLPEGASASSTLGEMLTILRGLSPRNVDSLTMSRAKRILACKTPEEMEKNGYDAENVKYAEGVMAKQKAITERRKAAQAAFDKIGGVSIHKDAKLNWDDDQGDWD